MTNQDLQRIMYNVFNEVDERFKRTNGRQTREYNNIVDTAEKFGVTTPTSIGVLLDFSWNVVSTHIQQNELEQSKARINELIITLIMLRAAIEEGQGTLPLVPDLTSS